MSHVKYTKLRFVLGFILCMLSISIWYTKDAKLRCASDCIFCVLSIQYADIDTHVVLTIQALMHVYPTMLILQIGLQLVFSYVCLLALCTTLVEDNA